MMYMENFIFNDCSVCTSLIELKAIVIILI